MSNIEAILNDLGWKDGFRIPVANEENKRLEEEIERKMKLKGSLSVKLESLEEKIKMVKKHRSNLMAQEDLNQKLLTEHSAQLQMEDHQYRLSCNTESSLLKEARDFEKEWNEVNQVVSRIEKDLIKIGRKIEETKKRIKFDECSLQQWEDALNKTAEDNLLIEKYLKEDAKKYKELELERQKRSMELELYRQTIVRASDEVLEMEIVLDRTARFYSATLKEGQQIFAQYKESVTALHQRDDDIERILREIETLREIIRDKKHSLQESEKFLQQQSEGNKRLKETIKQLEKKLTLAKEEHLKIKDSIVTYETELRLLRNNVKDLAHRTQQMRGDVKQKELEIEKKCVQLQDLKTQINLLSAKLENITSQKLSVEDKTKELEKMIEEQEKRKAAMIKEANRLQAANLRTTKKIQELENEIKVLDMEYQRECKKLELLDTLHEKEGKHFNEKKESLYQVEFELQKTEMKLERLRGYERDKSEAEKKQKTIEELQATLNEKAEVSKMLQKQIKNLERDMKKLSNSIANDNNELERLRNKKQELVLLMEGGEKQLKVAQAQSEERQVEESLLRLKLTQMEKVASNISNNVYNLEKYQLELEAAVKERKAEIAVQKESLIVEKRVAATESSELRNAISERTARIKQLQARYENAVANCGTNPDGTPMTTAYLKIQTAQEKYLLQEQGDKLDETIRKTEQEIQSMENTLRVINACNDRYKSCLTVGEEDDAEKEEQRILDEELRQAERNVKEREEEVQRLTKSLRKLEDKNKQLLKDVENAKQQKEDRERYLADLERQVNEQKDKISRADRNLRNAQRDIQNIFATTGDRTALAQEKEVELREMQEQNTIILQEVLEFTIRHVEAESYIKNLLAERNVELPSITEFGQTLILGRCPSIANSADCPKSTSRTSVFASSRESIGNIINIEPQFEAASVNSFAERNLKNEKKSAKPVYTRPLHARRSTQDSIKRTS